MKFFKSKMTKFLSAGCIIVVGASIVCNAQQPTGLMNIQGKKLLSPEMDLLNKELTILPSGIVRLFKAQESAKIVAGQLEANPQISLHEQKEVYEQIRFILSPVGQFFGLIRSYRNMIVPLIKESLCGQEASKNRIDTSECLILKFFESHDEVYAFFEKHVKTREQLCIACKEFLTFFQDIRVSLSDEALNAYKKVMEELKKKTQAKK